MTALAVLLALLAGLLAPASPSWAQAGDAGTFLSPFPENDRYRVQLLGDAMASGLADGLVELMAAEPRFQIDAKSRWLGGLMKGDFDQDLKALEARLQTEKPHVVVVMLGAEDRVPMRRGNRRFPVGSDEWKAEYARRLDLVMRAMRKRSIGVFWVGLPVMRRHDATDDAEMINELFRARALADGVRFIDIFASFADGEKVYAPNGPDLTGKMRLLRDSDGVHFTSYGYRKLAYFVERELKRAAQQAWDERTIPLAGTEAEQARIRPQPTVKLAPLPPSRQSAAGTPPASVAAKQATRAQSAGLAAETTRITLKSISAQGREEAVPIEIVRPAIPAAVLSLITRRQSDDKDSQVGDAVMTEILGGLTVVSSVTPLAETAGDRRRGPASAESPLYRVLQRGETLPSKPGRSDDMPWPRPEPVIARVAGAAAGANPIATASTPRLGPGLDDPPMPRRPTWAPNGNRR